MFEIPEALTPPTQRAARWRRLAGKLLFLQTTCLSWEKSWNWRLKCGCSHLQQCGKTFQIKITKGSRTIKCCFSHCSLTFCRLIKKISVSLISYFVTFSLSCSHWPRKPQQGGLYFEVQRSTSVSFGFWMTRFSLLAARSKVYASARRRQARLLTPSLKAQSIAFKMLRRILTTAPHRRAHTLLRLVFNMLHAAFRPAFCQFWSLKKKGLSVPIRNTAALWCSYWLFSMPCYTVILTN